MQRLFRWQPIHVAAVLFVGVSALGTASGGQTPATTPVQTPQTAMYFSHSDMDTVWKDLEARNAINKRVVAAGKYSINIRSIRETDAPLMHTNSIDIWIMEEGSAVSVTGGKLVDPKKKPNLDESAGSSIEGGVEQPFMPGDILYVPAGVPHGFKNVHGFRAYLIRINLDLAAGTETNHRTQLPKSIPNS